MYIEKAKLAVRAVNRDHVFEELVECLKLCVKSMKECDERQYIKRHASDPIFLSEQALSKAGEL